MDSRGIYYYIITTIAEVYYESKHLHYYTEYIS